MVAYGGRHCKINKLIAFCYCLQVSRRLARLFFVGFFFGGVWGYGFPDHTLFSAFDSSTYAATSSVLLLIQSTSTY